MKKLLLIPAFGFCLISSLNAALGDVTINVVDDYNNWNKTALVVENDYIELVILPEIGGRVIHYGFAGDEYMFVNYDKIDESFDPDVDNYGPWNGSVGYGGYKVWPAPQSKWNWPPPPHLAWGPYSYEVEHSSADSVVIYLESEEETELTPGLVFTRRYRVYKNSTKVTVEQTIINKNSSAQEWSIWDVTQAVVQHGDDADYSNFNVYFPVNKNDLWASDNSMLTDVTNIDNTISAFNFDGTSGKLFSFLDSGWACFVDERDSQTYTKLFSIETGDFPDDGANFEIYAGGNYIEIEVLSPIVNLAANSGTYTYNEEWYAANLNGPILNTNKAGAVKSKLSLSGTIVTGEFGIYNSGKLYLRYLDIANTILGTSNSINVVAAQNLVLNETVNLPEGTEKILLLAYDLNDNLIGALDGWNISTLSVNENKVDELNVYPTVSKVGGKVSFTWVKPETDIFSISMLDINAKTYFSPDFYKNENDEIIISVPDISPGIYFLKVQAQNKNYIQKIIIQ